MSNHRKAMLERAKVAGYHNDSATYWRICIEERINRNDLRKAWLEGVQAKRYGVRCECRGCAA